ncbi:hypothetical protein [Psychrobacillus sp.]|uniref:hypothetical protein n=1 Tax=Psychrobacillus sp. TaxID=1871623 RepID=UPI0028BD4207|nr:hypothetical protein [Psychrobacillus sp.]
MSMKLKHVLFAIIAFYCLLLASCSNGTNKDEEFPPTMTGFININETAYKMAVGNYKWERKQGLNTQVVETDAASPNQIAENYKVIMVEQDTTMNIEIEENPEISIYLWNEIGRDEEITPNKNQIFSPKSNGQYIYEILAKWPNGEVSYTFVIEVR